MSQAMNGKVAIYYETWNPPVSADRLEGDTIVFAHGAGGNAACWWQQIPHFADRYKVIAFDHRSFARSPCAPEEVDISHFAGDLRCVMDQEEVESAFLVCQSMGGWTGIQFALESPQRVKGLVMSHTPGGISTDQMTKLRNEATGSLEPLTEPFAHWALAPDFHRKAPELANLYNQISNFNTEFDLERLLSGMWQPIDPARLSILSLPVLFITARQDRIFPPRFIELAAREVPGAELVVLGEAGHSSYFESAALFNRTLDEFIRRCLMSGQ